MKRSLLLITLLALPCLPARAEVESSGALTRWVLRYQRLQREVTPSWLERGAWTESTDGRNSAYGVGMVRLPMAFDEATSAASLELMLTVAENRAATAVATLLATEADPSKTLPPGAVQRLASVVRTSATVVERFVAADGRNVYALARLPYNRTTLGSLLALATGAPLPTPPPEPVAAGPMPRTSEETVDPDAEIFIPAPDDGEVEVPAPDAGERLIPNPDAGETTIAAPDNDIRSFPGPEAAGETITIPPPSTKRPEHPPMPVPPDLGLPPLPPEGTAPATAEDGQEWHIPAPAGPAAPAKRQRTSAVTPWKAAAVRFDARVRKIGVLTGQSIRLNDGLAPRSWVGRDHWTSLGPGYRVVFAVGESPLTHPTDRLAVAAAFDAATRAAVGELPAELRSPRDPLDFYYDGEAVLAVLVGALIVE